MKRLAAMAFALISVATAASACSGVSSDAAASATGSPSATTRVTAHGIFVSTTPPPSGINAYAYDVRLAPRSAAADLTLTTVGGKTQALLAVSGFVPNRNYGAHLHVNPCGVDPKAAGGHFEHTPDPAASRSPSTNPAYANPTNEVWLDFDTDPKGSATSSAEVPWVATAQRHPGSLVIHADRTLTVPGKAGTAGARIACLTLPAS
jgi:Cu-Zn family superoxide dismutase